MRALKENIILYPLTFLLFIPATIPPLSTTRLSPFKFEMIVNRYVVLGVIGIIAVLVLWKTIGVTQYVEMGGMGEGDQIELKFANYLLIIVVRQAFLGLMLALANAYGLVLTVVLMGYGLVDIPRLVVFVM